MKVRVDYVVRLAWVPVGRHSFAAVGVGPEGRAPSCQMVSKSWLHLEGSVFLWIRSLSFRSRVDGPLSLILKTGLKFYN